MKTTIHHRSATLALVAVLLLASISLAQAQSPEPNSPDPATSGHSLFLPSIGSSQSDTTNDILSPENLTDVIEVMIPEAGVDARAKSANGMNWWTYNVKAFHGKKVVRFCKSDIREDTIAFAAASEGYYNNRHMGDAKFSIANIVPKTVPGKGGCIYVWIQVDWHYNLPVAVDLLWINR